MSLDFASLFKELNHPTFAHTGTSIEAIRTVVSSGKFCVINLHPQSLKLLRASDLKPYVVLVAPPSLEKLRQKKERNSEPVKVSQITDLLNSIL